MSSSNGKDNSGPGRDRYWLRHPGEKPTRRRVAPKGMQKRLMRETILNRVYELGSMSDVTVLRISRQEDLIRNLAFAIQQSRLWGALDRLKRQNPWHLAIPAKVQVEALASAEKALRVKK